MWRAIKRNGTIVQWENSKTGFGIACPPYPYCVIQLPKDLLNEEDQKKGFLGRAMKYGTGKYVRFYDVEDAKRCADLLAKAKVADNEYNAEYARYIQHMLDHIDDDD